MKHGAELFKLRQVNIALGGFINAAQAAGHEIVPVIWAGASASAHVTTEAFERIVGRITDAVRTGSFDAVFLNLHGAMVTGRYDDGAGEIPARGRQILGTDRPLVASLDKHANLATADALVIAARTKAQLCRAVIRPMVQGR